MTWFEPRLIGLALGVALPSVAWLRPNTPKGWLREWGLPITGLIGWVFVLISVMNLCALALSSLLPRLWPNASETAYRIVVAIGVIAGAYVCVIGLQVLGNIMRRARGQRPERINWIRVREK